VTAKTLRSVLTKHADPNSVLMTDELGLYRKTGKEFKDHRRTHHTLGEYVRDGGFTHTQTVESHFSLLKRGVFGTFHSLSEAHLFRYLAEFDFKANTRHLTDAERCDALLTGIKGKRLLYRQPDNFENA
jgi:hypothetical protein